MVATSSSKRVSGERDLADARPRAPSRKQGKQRVEQLLEAGAAVFVEKGFDLATMTEIAERAGSSIGSLYQFFPNKESMANMLRAQLGEALCERVAGLRSSAVSRSPAELADCLFEIDLDVLRDHPAFAVLAVTRGHVSTEITSVRQRLADELLALLVLCAPHMSISDLREVGMAIRQILRSSVELVVEAGGRDSASGVGEMRRVLRDYLSSRLKPSET